ncbi:MAG: hypothetical protein HYW79_03800 [Parcubacteria group bacterium]|nr:hypothetical protein [Parcubacteria group bacterium]
MRATVFIFAVFIFLVIPPVFRPEIENAADMPYRLDQKFIEDIWKKVIRLTNEEAIILKVEPDIKAPKIIYISEQPRVSRRGLLIAAKITYYVDKKILDEEKIQKVLLDYPRVIRIYPAAFLPLEMAGELVYGFIAQEFFHETLLQQYVLPDYHHCAMIYRGTLLKALMFIDGRLGTGKRITDTVIKHTKAQCEEDSGGRIRFK